MTRVYHIVQFESGDAYVTFDGCNWHCYYCVWRLNRWNICLPQDIKKKLDKLWNSKKIKFLSTEEVTKILAENKVKNAFFGGGEPTLDPEIKKLIKDLKRKGIEVWLITNGENLDNDIVSLVKGVTFSIKAINEDIHKKITGVSNKKVLENFKKYATNNKITAETVYDGKYVKCSEIIEIAKFISSLNKNMRFRIDPLVQGVNLSDVDGCIERVRKILPNTYRWKIKEKMKMPKLIYPKIGD